MEGAGRPGDLVARIRRLQGVSWEWREEAPIEAEGREAGVIAQDVAEVFPELVSTGSDGYLRVDYRGLAVRLAGGVEELRDRLERVEARVDPVHDLSDADAKRDLDPVAPALERLRAGEELGRADYTALVGALVEAVKSLDSRLAALEGEQDPGRGV